MVDISRLRLVLVLAGVLYAAAAVCLLHLAARWIRRRVDPDYRPPSGRRLGRVMFWVRGAILCPAALGLVCLAYARFVEPFWPGVERVRIETPKLAPGARPVRLVLIADTHSDPRPRLEPRLPDLVAGLRPDLVIFAGDAVNCEEGLPHFRECLRRIAEGAPTFAVRGNWEVWWFDGLDFYGGTRVRELDGEAVRVEAGGSEVWVAGAAVESRATAAALAGVPEGRFAIFVHHYPAAAPAAISLGADLVLSGDTHGGQVRLPLIGPLVRIRREGPYRDVGLHRLGGGWLYVNRGIGMEGGRAPRLRFMCRPEVTLIEIAPREKN